MEVTPEPEVAAGRASRPGVPGPCETGRRFFRPTFLAEVEAFRPLNTRRNQSGKKKLIYRRK